MKHSVQQLIDTVHEYFPRDLPDSDPRYETTAEWDRRKAARVPASARYEDWRRLLHDLESRFPPDEYPGVQIHNRSLFLQSPVAAVHLDRCFTGQLWLPVRSSAETHHMLEFLVSFVVPYYVIRSECQIPRDPRPGELPIVFEKSFALSPDEVPFAKAIAEEIETVFPGHEAIDREVGLTVVPDVVAGSKWFGEATIFTCLFSDGW